MSSSPITGTPSQVLTKICLQVEQQEWGQYAYAERTVHLLVNLSDHYGYPEVGRTRAVFKTPNNTVIKVPINKEGLMANSNEALASVSARSRVPIANCALAVIDNVQVLIMETVEPVAYYHGMPDWVFSVDCQQVGYTDKGRLVAYDF